jgi:hypothetical protein
MQTLICGYYTEPVSLLIFLEENKFKSFSFISLLYFPNVVSNSDNVVTNGKQGFGRKQWLPILRHHPYIRLMVKVENVKVKLPLA